MVKLGFSAKFIRLIMHCITTVSFSVILNGEVKGDHTSSKRSPTGLSSFSLFIHLCVTAFSSLLTMAERRNDIPGIRFKKDLTVSHLLFADDNLVFSRASLKESINLKQVFDCYAAASGQIFNFDKTSILFSPNCQ